MSRVRSGLDVVAALGHPALRRKRVGLIVHQASVTSRLEHAVDVLRRRRDFKVTALFAPEHGLGGELQDQVHVQGAADARTGLPVFSLYGEIRTPPAESWRHIDALVFDLQDVGVRYYTFIWTMALAMEAAARAGKTFVVLDRPNPLGGVRTEGNVPEPGFESFVGLFPLPVVHGLTTGELAVYLNETQGWKADLHVVKMMGWRRAMRFDETGLPWVMPSPNMPTLDTAAVYAGMCLLEATNLSEGRGTTRPFELFGAPFIDGHRLAEALARLKLPGAVFRAASFRPTFNKWAGEVCGGVQIHVTDPRHYPSYRTGLEILAAVRKLWPADFLWGAPPYEFEKVRPPMDILCGTETARRLVDAGGDIEGWLKQEEKKGKKLGAALRARRLYR